MLKDAGKCPLLMLPCLSLLFPLRLETNCMTLPPSLSFSPNDSLVSRFAQDVVKPKVLEMDESETMHKTVLDGLFEQGVSSGEKVFKGTKG